MSELVFGKRRETLRDQHRESATSMLKDARDIPLYYGINRNEGSLNSNALDGLPRIQAIGLSATTDMF